MKKIRIVLFVVMIFSLAGGFFYQKSKVSKIDNNPPEILIASDEIRVPISVTNEELKEYVIAMDEEDGNVSDTVLIENIEKRDKTVDNKFQITYAAFDKSGNYAEVSTDLYYTDYRKPRFSLTKPLIFSEGDKINLFDYFTANDCLDGDISAFITIDGVEELGDRPTKGYYRCTANVVNTSGDVSELPFIVEITEYDFFKTGARPTVVLNQYIVYLKKGEAFDPLSYLNYVEDSGKAQIDYGAMLPVTDENGEIKLNENNTPIYVTEKTAEGYEGKWVNISQIQIQSNVDTENKGVYYATYSYVSPSSGAGANTNLIVVVE